MINTDIPRDCEEREGHTHTHSFDKGLRLIKMALSRTVPPQSDGLQILESLARIADDDFSSMCWEILESRKNKGNKEEYINIQKG